MSQPSLCGSFLFFTLYDVCDEMRLAELHRLLGLASVGRETWFRHPAPEYVGFERPPVVEPLEAVTLANGARLGGRVKYYDYGVVSVQFELPFEGGWDALLDLACQYLAGTEVGRQAYTIACQKVERVARALIKPLPNWLSEDYCIIHVREVEGHPSAADLLAQYGDRIAQIVRGESTRLSDGERHEILANSMSYYPNDLAVVGWNAAFVYDTAAGAEATVQLLEYANSQLLEFRHYDEVLTRQLQTAYQSLEKGTGFLARWRLARVSARLYTLLLEVTELTERSDNALKFLSDMFSARLYRLAAEKVGVPDYKKLVHDKLRTAEGLYQFMVEQFHQGRAFVLELIVVIILIIDLIFLVGGKK
ncbi:MAG: hypothetical protein LAN62_00230 [Acidobacteriia bacterium]|nr:hypothetical protein [Terriglobia bacterium]